MDWRGWSKDLSQPTWEMACWCWARLSSHTSHKTGWVEHAYNRFSYTLLLSELHSHRNVFASLGGIPPPAWGIPKARCFLSPSEQRRSVCPRMLKITTHTQPWDLLLRISGNSGKKYSIFFSVLSLLSTWSCPTKSTINASKNTFVQHSLDLVL